MNASAAMRKKSLWLFLLSCIGLVPLLRAQDVVSNAAPTIKTFLSEKEISGIGSNSVNLFTGDVALPLNLITLPGHNGLDASVAISYSSNVQHQVDVWNLESPAGILGLGWSMDIPKIVTDHKQTGTRVDDEFFLVKDGASVQLIRSVGGSDGEGSFYTYELKGYQFWKIKFYYEPADYALSGSGSNKWVIITDDGTRYVYGDKNSNRSTIQWVVRWGNWIGHSADLSNQTQMANIWNLSEISNTWNEKITFEYENVEQYVGFRTHTEASYLKHITDVIGRKVTFVYKDKQHPYYMEPHTEKQESDAYQEFYEKKYLDKIEVYMQTNQLFLSVHFAYGTVNAGTNAAKMLLTSIVQRNGDGHSMPPLKFDYIQSGVTKGTLQKVTLPAGGTISYTYSEKTIYHGDREFLAQAPAGFAEPKVWMGDDYAVVAWRQLGSGSTHDDNPREVRLYVYTWVGEWKEQFLQTISSVALEGVPARKEYKDFQVRVERDFFAVLSRTNPGSNNHTLFIRLRDQHHRGLWDYYTQTNDYGNEKPTLLSGTNFVAVGSEFNDANYPSRIFTYLGSSFRSEVLTLPYGHHDYTATNNFIISHKMGLSFIGTAPEINFSFLTEDKKWVTRNMGSPVTFYSDEPSFWHSSNGMAIAMADDNPEFAYRWTIDYNTFYQDSKDKNNVDLFGGLSDLSSVFITGNSMVGIDGHLARWDGTKWSSATVNTAWLYASYGEDFVIRPVSQLANGNYRGGRKVFNPNTLNWEADVIHDGPEAGFGTASAGLDYYFYSSAFYYRQRNGTWVRKNTPPNMAANVRTGTGWPRFDMLYGVSPGPVLEVRWFKNGELAGPLYFSGRNAFSNPYKMPSQTVGVQTTLTYLSLYLDHIDAQSLYLNRMVGDALTGYQKDYPVTLVTVNDGTEDKYTTLFYSTSTATLDASGSLAQYNEVTEIPGSSDINNRPNGWTTTFFHNGLTGAELSEPGLNTDLMYIGATYRKDIYNYVGQKKSSQSTYYTSYSRPIQNDQSATINTAKYVRAYRVTSMLDNIETVTDNDYDSNTGFLKKTVVSNYDSKGGYAITYYKYFWEVYDVNRSMNLLSPIVQIVKSVVPAASSEIFTEAEATTWKQWSSIYAPHKVYSWKKTGSYDFSFLFWSGANEPGGDWFKVSEVNAIDQQGNILQVTNY